MDPQTLKQEAQQLLSLMGITAKELRVVIDNDIHFTIVSLRLRGNDAEIFREHNNEVLRSFTLIFKMLVEKKYHFYKDCIVDVNEEEIKLINHTKEKAEIALERVEFFDKPYTFGYLNAYERMLIHQYLKNHPHIISESEGEKDERRLVIKKKDA